MQKCLDFDLLRSTICLQHQSKNDGTVCCCCCCCCVVVSFNQKPQTKRLASRLTSRRMNSKKEKQVQQSVIKESNLWTLKHITVVRDLVRVQHKNHLQVSHKDIWLQKQMLVRDGRGVPAVRDGPGVRGVPTFPARGVGFRIMYSHITINLTSTDKYV